MDCEHVQGLLGSFFDDELEQEQRKAVEAHLSMCDSCARSFQVLKSIDTAGKSIPGPAPAAGYWRQMRRQIKHRIEELDRQPARAPTILELLRRIVWPDRVSTRLVGLTATAVIVFFIVRLSIVRQGGLEYAPEALEGQAGALKAVSGREKSGRSQAADKEVDMIDEQSKEAITVETVPGSADADQTGAGVGKMQFKQESEPEIPATREVPSMPGEIRRDRSVAADHQRKVAGIARTSPQPLAMDTAVGKPVPGIRLKDVVDVTESAQPDRVIHAVQADQSISAMAVTEAKESSEERVAARHVSTEGAAISGEELYALFDRKAAEAEGFPDKIRLWEEYLIMNPGPEYTHRAMYEQAKLYYGWAKDEMTRQRIAEALKFYRNNQDSFQSENVIEELKKMMSDLESLLKKIEEK